jgi:transketolase
MLAGHHSLGNLTCIIDHNHSTDRALKIDPLVMKFESFGWKALEVDGHNADELERALSVNSVKPLAIIARTIKGHGVQEMENNPAWHHGAPSEEQLLAMIESLQ